MMISRRLAVDKGPCVLCRSRDLRRAPGRVLALPIVNRDYVSIKLKKRIIGPAAPRCCSEGGIYEFFARTHCSYRCVFMKILFNTGVRRQPARA